MSPRLFFCSLARALVRHAGNALGLGIAGDVLVSVGDEVWRDWARDHTEPERRLQLEAVTRATPDDTDSAIDEAVLEVAGDRPQDVRDRLSECLRSVPDRLRASLRRPDDPAGLSVPPGQTLQSPADLVALLSIGDRHETAAEPPPSPQDGPAVSIVPTKGVLQGTPFVFTERALAVVGKEGDCTIRLPDDNSHQFVSRHHCLLDIAPPAVRLLDLGSRNGTFVNGGLLGQRPDDLSPTQARGLDPHERDLEHGDEFHLTRRAVAAFRIEIAVPPRCGLCSAVIPKDQTVACEGSPGVFECPACRARATACEPASDSWQITQVRPDVCARCKRPAPGGFLCADCRGKDADVAAALLEQAQIGPPALSAIRGYQIVAEVGKGGMGAVYRARHERTGQDVALKVMLPDVAACEDGIRRFRREMGILGALRHPHVVRQLDWGDFRGVIFMTLEYCDGGSVAGLLEQRGGTLPVDEAVEITLQALDGLHHAHTALPGRPVVHRDLKPGNLLLSGSGSARIAKVADFGLAKAFDDAGLSNLTATGTRAGSPWYMPRQQVVRFKSADPAVDVWAMAATLYGMLTGSVPRDFISGKDRWLVVLEDDPVPIRRRQPSVPAKLAEVIDNALQEKPAIGFRTALDFKEALEDAV